MYTENYKMLMKEIEGTNKWKDIVCSWIGRINIKMSTLLKAVCRLNAIPIKNSIYHKCRTNLKFVWDHERSQIAKTIVRENKAKGIMLPDFMPYNKPTVVNAVAYGIGIKTDTKINGTDQRSQK